MVVTLEALEQPRKSFSTYSDAEIFFPKELIKIRVSKALTELGANYAIIIQITNTLCIEYYRGANPVKIGR